ncbi:stage V sporulation protein AC [Paenibacillus sp.]|uniref:stage V sporulation protein AC n=1 Tax=Paenibacillus sp. TaxID=58172 RepID=UPI002D43E4D1|nr:stage V sporulation protein AC [Paenibacillus sp.]HZG84111.1 stage V sporulation protein AC [Paenibacillus sp.]
MTSATKRRFGLTAKEYQKMAKAKEPARPVLRNCFRAFVAGGTICVIGQMITTLFVHYAGMSKEQAGVPTVVLLILLSVVLTSLGVYDKIAQWAGAGTAVPVTGFANSMSSAAIEHRSEGIVLGVATRMFKLAGAVVVFGTVSAFLVAFVHWIIGTGGQS